MRSSVLELGVKISIILCFTAFLAACGSSRQATNTVPDPVGPAVETPAVDESFDPIVLQDEDLSFPEKAVPTERAEVSVLPGEAEANREVEQNRVVDGYRVQIFATQNIENATLQKKEAEFVFVADTVALYIEFDSPMYKIRVGDCLNRADAENLREISRKHGYPTSFIVKTKVNTVPNVPRDSDALFDEQ